MISETTISETAPAKVNLYLHIGGIREDGLHDLASLFVFTRDGDRVFVERADTISLTITGPFAAALSAFPTEENLVWKAASLLKEEFSVDSGVKITLEKNLPIAAGIGGGSADAAAALRALVRHWNLTVPEDTLSHLAFRLGADVPACLNGAPVDVTGAGETVSLGPKIAPFWICLVNPGIATPTGSIFTAFDAANPTPQTPALALPRQIDEETIEALLRETRNDLETAACLHAPEIKETLGFLEKRPGVLGARMSGSGATCFALFRSEEESIQAAAKAKSFGWWALASQLEIG